MPTSLPSYLSMLLFIAFAYPITVGSISANYAFLLYPFIYLCYTGRLRKPPVPIGACIFIFSLFFVIGGVDGIARGQESVERILFSFVTFISIFAFVVVDLRESEMIDFRRAIVIISLAFCLKAIVTFLLAGGSALGYDQKDLVGSQRYGFIYLLAFYILLMWKSNGLYTNIFRIGSIIVIALGLFLTFSRSSIIGLGGSLIILWAYLVFKGKFGIGSTLKLLAAIVLLMVLVSILAKDFYFLYDFFFERIIERLFLTDSAVLLSPETSEGTRIEIWSAVVENTLASPIWGAGYLGTWSMKGIVAGSAHSQYMDVLFRVGFVGAAIWLGILFAVMRHLYRAYHDVFWGFVAILIYGLFHETFKESHGSFILAFVVGIYASHLRNRHPHALPRAAMSAGHGAQPSGS